MRRTLALLTVLFGLTAGGPAPAWSATGQLQLTVIDKDTRKPIACRIHLKSPNGKPRKAEHMPFWQDHFVFPGSITLKLPLGGYTFELERGLEYVTCSGNFTIENFADDSKEVELRRFVDMSKEGWWSGDIDVRRPVNDIELLMRADDLHVVPVITATNDKNDWAGKTLPKQGLIRGDENRWYHVLGGVYQRAGGTFLALNLDEPLLVGDPGAEYPPPAILVQKARQSASAWIDWNRPYGWDLPMLVANHLIDSIEIAHGQIGRERTINNENGGKPRDPKRYPGAWGNAEWSQQIYFHLLNCGLRIPPSAGSGSGVSPNPVGYNRMYVHVDGDFSYEKWWESLRAGRVMITNGPLLRPNVEGEMPGHVFKGEAGKTVALNVGLTLSTRDPISYLEIIKDGQVVDSIRVEEFVKMRKLPKMTFDASGWFLIRAVADVKQTYRFGLTGPYFVEFNYQPRISKRSVQFFLDWLYERARQIDLADATQRAEVIEYHRKARDFWQDLLKRANAE